MSMQAKVEELWRYPVKSMGGESLPELDVTAGGARGDRAWAVRDEVRGGIRGAKKIARLMLLEASYPQAPVGSGSSPAEILLPDGTRISTGAADVHERLSAALDHPVTLWPLLPADALDHYRRGAPDDDDFESELRTIFGRSSDEPLPDLGVFPPELMEFESPPGTYFDAFPLLIVTRQSLASLAQRAPASRFDVRRFRPNIVLDAATDASEPFPELGWSGRRLALGGCVLRLEVDCPRCVMITHGFADLPRDPSVMRTVVQAAGGSVGVYASVETAGIVRVGDPARWVS
jgi:uncharacterized protein YcbX